MRFFRVQVSWDGGQTFVPALVMRGDVKRPFTVAWAATSKLERRVVADLGRVEHGDSAKDIKNALSALLRRIPRDYVPTDSRVPEDLEKGIAESPWRLENRYGPLAAWEQEADSAALRRAVMTARGDVPGKDRLLGLVRSRYPGWLGFSDPRFDGGLYDEVQYMLETVAKAKKLLSKQALRSLIDAGHHGEMIERLKAIGRDTNLLFRPYSPGGDLDLLYHAGLEPSVFCEAFLSLLHGDGDVPYRLDRYSDQVGSMGVPPNVNRWAMPTYFLFFLYPNEEVLIKPRTVRTLLDLGGWGGKLGVEPSGEEYVRVRTAYLDLRKALEEHEPRHMIDVQGFAWVAVQEANERAKAAKRARATGHEQDPRIDRAMEEFEREADAHDLIRKEKLLEQAQVRFREIFGTAAKIESLSPDGFFGLFNELDAGNSRSSGLFRLVLNFPKNPNTKTYRRFEEDLPTFRRALVELLCGAGSEAERLDRMWEIGRVRGRVRNYITESLIMPSALLFLQDPNKWSSVMKMEIKEKKVALAGIAPVLADDASLGERFVALERAMIQLSPKYGRKHWTPMTISEFYFSEAFKRHFGEPHASPQSLTSLIQSLEDRGLHFSREAVANYVLALQTKRFAILTGVSGTGKTSLAIEVARYFGLPAEDPDTPSSDDAADSRDGNYTVVPVRPDWVDNRGLLGYYNPLTNDYLPTPFLRLLLEARAETKLAEEEEREPSPFFVVLDEMNLARVEHYFSDFLSAMESGEAIPLHDDPSVERGEMQVSGSGRGDSDASVPVPRTFKVPDNVFFTGTINVDETTYMFSPKVLDRAFTCELNEVDLRSYASGHGDDGPNELTLDTLHPLGRSNRGEPSEVHGKRSESGWRPSRRDWLEFCKLSDGRFRDRLLELHGILEGEHRHFGYRVANEIARFVLLAHAQSSNKDVAVEAAFDLAVLQKVLPKFHGTQQELEPLLRRLLGFAVEGGVVAGSTGDEPRLDEWLVIKGRLRLRARSARVDIPAAESEGTTALQAPESVDDALEREAEAPSAPALALPRTGAKIWRMLRRLEQRGFTSFVE